MALLPPSMKKHVASLAWFDDTVILFVSSSYYIAEVCDNTGKIGKLLETFDESADSTSSR